MAISSLIYESWMKERQYRKYAGLSEMLEKADLEGKVLDIGIGTGLFEDYLAGRGEKLDVKGIELDPRMLQDAVRKGYDAAPGTAESLPFENESFDFVVCFDVIHAVKDKPRAIREMMRVLKPGKCAMVSHFCSTFTRKETEDKMERLTQGIELADRKVVGSQDDELSVVFLLRKG